MYSTGNLWDCPIRLAKLLASYIDINVSNAVLLIRKTVGVTAVMNDSRDKQIRWTYEPTDVREHPLDGRGGSVPGYNCGRMSFPAREKADIHSFFDVRRSYYVMPEVPIHHSISIFKRVQGWRFEDLMMTTHATQTHHCI
jgi:hypothetical protein